jgi:P-type Cu2+ transporter
MAGTAPCRWRPWSPTCATGSWSPPCSPSRSRCGPIGREVLGFQVAAPFGLRDDVWLLLLSLPVIFYSCWIFFDGAVRALRARTLDMMVLVAVAGGAGWLSAVFVTLTGVGEVFYEAATVLAAFVLLGPWFEMRARGGANDAIHSLLDLAPPRALVLGDGEPVEVPTAEVGVGDLLLVRPGAPRLPPTASRRTATTRSTSRW